MRVFPRIQKGSGPQTPGPFCFQIAFLKPLGLKSAVDKPLWELPNDTKGKDSALDQHQWGGP